MSATEQIKDFFKILKWFGLAIIIALPLILIVKKLMDQKVDAIVDDEGMNIFKDELEI